MLYKFKDRLTTASQEIRNRFRKAQILAELNPEFAKTQPKTSGAEKVPAIDLYMKDMFQVQDVEGIFKYVIPKL